MWRRPGHEEERYNCYLTSATRGRHVTAGFCLTNSVPGCLNVFKKSPEADQNMSIMALEHGDVQNPKGTLTFGFDLSVHPSSHLSVSSVSFCLHVFASSSFMHQSVLPPFRPQLRSNDAIV